MQRVFRLVLLLLVMALTACKVEETNLCGDTLECCEIRLQGQAQGSGSQFCTTCASCQQRADRDEEHTCPLSTADAKPGECWNTATKKSAALFANYGALAAGNADAQLLKSLTRMATIELAGQAPVKFTAGATLVSTLEERSGEADYCLARCESTNPQTASFCDQYTARNDVAYALLDLTATYAGTPDVNVRTPFAEVAERYKIAPNLLCGRKDVVVQDGRFSNEGDVCESFVTLSEGYEGSPPQYLWIHTPTEVAADLKSSSPIAIFEPGKAFHVDPRNDIAAPDTKGDIRTVVQTSKKSRLALEVATQNGPACLELRSEAESTNGVEAALARLSVEDMGPALSAIRDDVQKLKSLQGRVDLRRVEMDLKANEGQTPAPFLVMTSLARAARDKQADLRAMESSAAQAGPTTAQPELDVSDAMYQAALLVDIAACHERYKADWAGVGYVLPMIAPGAAFGPNTVRDRNELAGDLLLCRFVGASMRPEVRAELMKIAQGELPVHEEAMEASSAASGL